MQHTVGMKASSREPQVPDPTDPPDAPFFSWGDDQWALTIAALILIGLMLVWFYRYERPRRRQDAERDQRVADAAALDGWLYEPSSPRAVAGLAFPPFDRATVDGHRVRRVISGTGRGLRFRAFDIEHDRPREDVPAETYRYSVLAVALSRPARAILIAPASLYLDAERRERRLPRREPLLEFSNNDRGEIRTLTVSRSLAATVTASVIAVLDDFPGVGWGIDGDTMLLIRGGPGPTYRHIRHRHPRHWVEDLDEGLETLRRIDRALPAPMLDTAAD